MSHFVLCSEFDFLVFLFQYFVECARRSSPRDFVLVFCGVRPNFFSDTVRPAASKTVTMTVIILARPSADFDTYQEEMTRYHTRYLVEEESATSFECMARYARTQPALSTQHGLGIGWSATCDRECTIVVHIHIVMSCGSSRMHAMQNTKQTRCSSTPYASRRYDTWCNYFISNPSFNEYSSTCSTPSVRTDYSS